MFRFYEFLENLGEEELSLHTRRRKFAEIMILKDISKSEKADKFEQIVLGT